MRQSTGSRHGETIRLDIQYFIMVRILNVKTKLNILYLENGHWLIGDKYQNVGGFKSVSPDLADVPTKGWLYNDRTKWNDNDTTITVTGEAEERREIKHLENISVGDLFHYPERVTVSSTGGASEIYPSEMGVYKITDNSHSGRPVWQSSVQEDGYLFYDGITTFLFVIK